MILPPGTILQQMYFRERLRALPPGRFVEVGAGQGIVSRTLLDLGWSGSAYDMNGESLKIAAQVNRSAISEGRYRVIERDWLDAERAEPADLIVSCMVIEHMADVDESRYFERCKSALRPGGTRSPLRSRESAPLGNRGRDRGSLPQVYLRKAEPVHRGARLSVRHLAGLTFPVSNVLYSLSEYLVRRAERNEMNLAVAERTRLSGNRAVRL